jgi:hypothetical protein
MIRDAAPSQGFVYVVNHEKYLLEGLRSIESLARVMPQASIAVVCPPNLFRSHPAITHWVPLQTQRAGPIVKADATLAPFERAAFVDTDTMFARDMTDVFHVLDAFDLAAAHEPTRGWDYETPAPLAFCEFNTGFIVFRNDSKVRKLFQDWVDLFDQMLASQKLRNDQPSFRTAIWSNKDIRVATLPSEYHCICGKPVSIAWGAGLLHDRGDLPAIEKVINRDTGYRAYIPGWGQLRGYCGRKQWIRSYIELTKRFWLVLLFRRFRTDHSAKIPVRWNEPHD